MPTNFQPRPPDYKVSALDKDTDRKGQIGAAWRNDDGTITLRLNAFTVLDTTRHNLEVRLFPTERQEAAPVRGRKPQRPKVEEAVDDGNIPF